MQIRYRVNFIEYISGWGCRPDESYEEFPSYEQAKDYQLGFNRRNNPVDAKPMWYIVAEDPVEVTVEVARD